MKISDDKRREIAARLREVRSVPEWATTACCIAELVGEYDYPLWKNGSEQLFYRLADLIEPEPERTCRQVLTEYNDGLMPPFTAYCSECCAQWGFTPNYCPNCGAKVVEK